MAFLQIRQNCVILQTGKVMIRQAEERDLSRIAEILVFSKRMNYRSIFHNDAVSFGEIQVLPVAEELRDANLLRKIFVYDDGFVKGMIHVDDGEVCELYVDPFFTDEGIGSQLLQYCIGRFGVNWLWVLEKNERAIRFYQRFGFEVTGEVMSEKGSDEVLVKMKR